MSSNAIALSVGKAWYAVPQIVRFGMSGTLGNVIFYIMDQNFYKFVMLRHIDDFPKIVNRNAESISFFISYLGQVVIQHMMNAALVFGLDTIRGKYFQSLLTCYTTYASTLIVSTFFNAFLLERGISKNVAFWFTLYGFGIINFILLSRVSDSQKVKDHQSEHGVGRGGAFHPTRFDEKVSIIVDLMNLHSRSAKENKSSIDAFVV